MEEIGTTTRKRSYKTSVEYVEKKKKEESGTLLKSPLFGTTSSKHVGSDAVGLARSPLFGGKQDKTLIGISDLMVGSYPHASITGRVSFIGDVTLWNNGRSQGKVATFGILNQKAEVSVSIFNEKLDECFTLLEVNKVVEVSGFRVKAVGEKFQKINGQGLEVVLDVNGSVRESSEYVEPITYNFMDILQIDGLAVGSPVDFLGIAYEAKELVEGTSNAGKQFAFKTIMVTDKTELQYTVKLWGEAARKLMLQGPTVFVLRRGKLESYEAEKYVNATGSSMFWLNSTIPEAVKLQDWLKNRLSQQ